MSDHLKISLVLITYEMGRDLRILLDNFTQENVLSTFLEVIIVNDGSSDETDSVIDCWRSQLGKPQQLVVVSNEVNQGRFKSRILGCEAARGELVFFVDTRVSIPSGFAENLRKYTSISTCLLPMIRIKEEQSIFHLYWQRTHYKIFAKTFQEIVHGQWINQGNVQSALVGTTALLCSKQDFLAACNHFPENTINDDTPLLRKLVEITPMYRHQEFFVWWSPRTNYSDFLRHIFLVRGLSFADYHFFKKWSTISHVFLLGAYLFFLDIAVLIKFPTIGFSLLSIEGLLLALSTLFFVDNLREFFRLLPLHFFTVLAYGFGSLIGIARILLRKIFI